jgi:menaquinone-9 beta-reductase
MNAAPERIDHLVIGGGPAGCMAAIRLAEAGRRVTLVEKERTAHHKVCGEFLSQEAVSYLHQLGILPEELGAASIRFVRLSAGHRSAEAKLPFRALSLSRHMLDSALLRRAADEGCNIVRGASVDRLNANNDVWIAQLNDGQWMSAQTVFLASGKHDLHGWGRGPGTQSDLIGFKLHWSLAATQTEELHEWMELFLFGGGYGGLSLVEKKIANLCLVVRRRELRESGAWQTVLATVMKENPRLRYLLDGAKELWGRPLAISPIPYGYLAERSCGVWRVGDQAAVIPSFTGDGMSIALHSANLAAQMYLAGENADGYARTLHGQLGRMVSQATWISRSIVSRPGRKLALFSTSLFPGTMRWIAATTRVPASALHFDNVL